MPDESPRELLQDALALAREGDYPAARERLLGLSRELPHFPDVYFYLGLVEEQTGDTALARAAFERCLALDPFHDEARKRLRALSAPDSIEGIQPPAPENSRAQGSLPPRSPAWGPDSQGIEPPFEPYRVRPAGFWIRTLAALVDLTLLWFAVGPVLMVAMAPFAATLDEIVGMDPEELMQLVLEGDEATLWALLVAFLVETTVMLLVHTFAFSYFHYVSGQTPGKRIAGVRVVALGTLDYLSLGQSVGRYAGTQVSGCLCGIGYLMAAFNPEKRALHDFIAGTRVVYSEPVPMSAGEMGVTALLALGALAAVALRLLDWVL